MLNGSPTSALEARITRNLPTLSPKLKQVATYCLQHARHLHLCRIQDVALRCETQPVTVVRVAKRYGFRGFLDFKMAFLAEAERCAPSVTTHSHFAPHRAVQLLVQARTVWVQATPETTHVAHCYAHMLRLAGLAVQWLHPSPGEASEHDVLLSLSLAYDEASGTDAVRVAQRTGIPLVAITDGLEGFFSSTAGVHVSVAHLGDGLHGISAGMVLAYAVQDALRSGKN